MSSRYQGGFLTASYNGLKVPDAPTIGTATASSNALSVTFTAPSNIGGGAITSYTAFASPGGATGTGASSPVTISGLTNGTAYTATVVATNAYGTGPASAASNSVTPSVPVGQQAYTTAGSYTWVAPAGVTKVSVVAVGSGGRAASYGTFPASPGIGGGGGGALAYKNNITVIPGTSYSVTVGCGNLSTNTNTPSGANSNFNCQLVAGGGRQAKTNAEGGVCGGAGGTVLCGIGNGGGAGGSGKPGPLTACYLWFGGGGGAGGYAGAGGAGANYYNGAGSAGSGGAGGGGGAGTNNAGSGGGVGILGQGSSGAGGASATGCATSGGAGSGGSGALYGGGANYLSGNRGAVRIIWPGCARSFPSTCTGNL